MMEMAIIDGGHDLAGITVAAWLTALAPPG